MTPSTETADQSRSTAVRRIGEFVRFGAAGAAALAVEIVLFWVLVEVGMSPLVANPITMVLRLAVAFWLTRTMVFGEREVRPVRVELPLFLAVAAANLLVVELALWIALEATGGDLGPTLASAVKVGAICVTLVGRYAISRRFVFRAR